MQNQKIFTLLQVTKSIQKTIADRYTSAFWVSAEMNKLNHYKHSGHCYPELVEKENGKVIAQINGILWKNDYITANNKFLSILKEPLKDGIKILFLARISFDPAHGMALQILGIDPAYTLGDLEREKQETITKLHAEGIYNQNKSLPFPLLPQRIAIISVETSKGYADFLSVMDGNQWNYKFFHHLFPSLLQGEKAVDGIISQLKRIHKVRHHFDVVAIIRGGGGDVGLSCYNSYRLAKAIASFPLPVITGIGHATNVTVAEMISHLNAITPTKLADYLLQRFHDYSVPVQRAEAMIIDKAKRLILENQVRLNTEVRYFRSGTDKILIHNKNDVSGLSKSLFRHSQFRFRNERENLFLAGDGIRRRTNDFIGNTRQGILTLKTSITKDVQILLGRQKLTIENAEKNVANMSPQNVLKRGYSITLFNGHALKSIQKINKGDEVETILYDGNFTSTVNTTNNKTNE